MTCRQYAPVLEGCSYVDSLPFDGEPWELDRAVAEARKHSVPVTVTQVVGPPDLIKRFAFEPAGIQSATEESFQKTSWRLAGRLKDWSKQIPLVFDRRNKERETDLVADYAKACGRKQFSRAKKYILVNTSGKTSPFQYSDLLMTLLRLRFHKHSQFSIIDLAKLKAERFFDLLPFYERAHCLVSIDTATLHLAAARPTLPVVAIVNDKPSLWHGSCWRPNHIALIRYSDFPKRAVEMLDAIDNIMTPASYFTQGVKGRKIVHVWSQHEIADETIAARETWGGEYLSGHWIATPIERGAIGRDSKSVLKDDKRVPFVKDVIRLATYRAKDDDLICLTRAHTCFEKDLTCLLLNAKGPVFAHRTVRDEAASSFHPAADLFCFSKKWWREHQSDYPDMVMGKDPYWHRILMELIKNDGGKELKSVIYRNAE